MKKIIICFLLIFSSVVSFSDDEFGIIKENDLMSVGVSKENVKKAKNLIEKASNSYKLKVLEKKQLELELNKLILDDPSKNLQKIDKIFDEMAKLDASIMKERVRSQIEMQKYISTEQYSKARDIAARRMVNEK